MNSKETKEAYESSKSDFQKCKTHLERVNFALKRLNQASFDHTITQLYSKSNKKSLNKRNFGNTFFKNGGYFDALECYTSSIAFAESEKFMSLAYGNRSAVLAKLGLYTECLTDIERALESGYPEELKFKLFSRREKVVKLIKPVNSVQDSVEPGGCLQVQDIEQFGRHMVASRDIEIGEVLLVEKPLVTVVKKDFAVYCHECLALCYNPIPCTNCSKLLYCNEKCRETAFGDYHKYECPIVQYIDPDFTIGVKVTLAALVEKHKTGDFGRYRHIFSLKTYEDDPKKQRGLFTTAFVTAFVFKLFKEKTNFFTEIKNAEDSFKELLYWTFLVGHVNGVIISRLEPKETEFDIVAYGNGIYHEYSFFNHSCCPNVFFYHNGSTLVMRALSTIKKGEQCFISYGTTYSSNEKAQRQRLLLQDFSFECTCKACEEDWPTDMLSEDFYIPLMCVTQAQLQFDHNLLRSIAPSFIRRLKELEPQAPVKNFGTLRQLVVNCFQIYSTVRKSNTEKTEE